MTLEQLSATTVKVQISDSERAVFLPDTQCVDPDAPQMLRLMSFLLAKAELFCEIPFSQGQVSVEMLSTEDGGLIFYFSLFSKSVQKKQKKRGTSSISGEFSSLTELCEYCRLLLNASIKISSSVLYQMQKHYVLLIQMRTNEANFITHLLGEYGKPLEMTPLLRAKIAEYGICLYPKHAIRRIAEAENHST